MMVGRTLLSVLLAVVALLRIDAFSVPRHHQQPFSLSLSQRTTTTTRRIPPSLASSSRVYRLAAAKKDKDEEDEKAEPGMAEAFRELDALKSLDGENSKKPVAPPSKKIDSSQVDLTDAVSPGAASPEAEVRLYKDMMQELETTDEEDLYSTMLQDMGGTATPKTTTSATDKDSSAHDDDDDDTKSREDFMNAALDEALSEVKVNNPSSSVDSILNDKEIMDEIEAIFDRGNEQLIESLEEMRREQQELAKASAAKNAQKAADTMEDDAKRLAAAEASMQVMLDRVNQETAEVAKAVEDLKQAQEELDSGFVSKLRKGGIPKQAALVGLVLFAGRSIVDSVAALSSGGDMTSALIQGAIAFACAIVFFIL